MASGRRPRVKSVNPQLMCTLCAGYLIDATTLTECLHSFCRTCILQYLLTSKYCPVCDVQVYKSRPALSVLPDIILQRLVFKLVPGLYQAKQTTSREARGDVRGLNCPFPSLSDKISVCLENSSRLSHLGLPKQKRGSVGDQRHLLCPAALSISLLKKFISCKFDLSSDPKIDVFYENEPLWDDCTLLDVIYIYNWSRKKPLHLHYVVQDERNASQQDEYSKKPVLHLQAKPPAKKRGRKRKYPLPVSEPKDVQPVVVTVVDVSDDDDDDCSKKKLQDTAASVSSRKEVNGKTDSKLLQNPGPSSPLPHAGDGEQSTMTMHEGSGQTDTDSDVCEIIDSEDDIQVIECDSTPANVSGMSLDSSQQSTMIYGTDAEDSELQTMSIPVQPMDVSEVSSLPSTEFSREEEMWSPVNTVSAENQCSTQTFLTAENLNTLNGIQHSEQLITNVPLTKELCPAINPAITNQLIVENTPCSNGSISSNVSKSVPTLTDITAFAIQKEFTVVPSEQSSDTCAELSPLCSNQPPSHRPAVCDAWTKFDGIKSNNTVEAATTSLNNKTSEFTQQTDITCCCAHQSQDGQNSTVIANGSADSAVHPLLSEVSRSLMKEQETQAVACGQTSCASTSSQTVASACAQENNKLKQCTKETACQTDPVMDMTTSRNVSKKSSKTADVNGNIFPGSEEVSSTVPFTTTSTESYCPHTESQPKSDLNSSSPAKTSIIVSSIPSSSSSATTPSTDDSIITEAANIMLSLARETLFHRSQNEKEVKRTHEKTKESEQSVNKHKATTSSPDAVGKIVATNSQHFTNSSRSGTSSPMKLKPVSKPKKRLSTTDTINTSPNLFQNSHSSSSNKRTTSEQQIAINSLQEESSCDKRRDEASTEEEGEGSSGIASISPPLIDTQSSMVCDKITGCESKDIKEKEIQSPQSSFAGTDDKMSGGNRKSNHAMSNKSAFVNKYFAYSGASRFGQNNRSKSGVPTFPSRNVAFPPLPSFAGKNSSLRNNRRTGNTNASYAKAKQPNSSLSRTGQPNKSVMKTEQLNVSLTKTAQASTFLPKTSQPSTSLSNAEQPSISLANAGQLSKSITSAGQLNASLTSAGQPNAPLTSAGQPSTSLTKSGQPCSSLTKTGQLSTSVTKTGQPNTSLIQTPQTNTSLSKTGQHSTSKTMTGQTKTSLKSGQSYKPAPSATHQKTQVHLSLADSAKSKSGTQKQAQQAFSKVTDSHFNNMGKSEPRPRIIPNGKMATVKTLITSAPGTGNIIMKAIPIVPIGSSCSMTTFAPLSAVKVPFVQGLPVTNNQQNPLVSTVTAAPRPNAVDSDMLASEEQSQCVKGSLTNDTKKNSGCVSTGKGNHAGVSMPSTETTTVSLAKGNNLSVQLNSNSSAKKTESRGNNKGLSSAGTSVPTATSTSSCHQTPILFGTTLQKVNLAKISTDNNSSPRPILPKEDPPVKIRSGSNSSSSKTTDAQYDPSPETSSHMQGKGLVCSTSLNTCSDQRTVSSKAVTFSTGLVHLKNTPKQASKTIFAMVPSRSLNYILPSGVGGAISSSGAISYIIPSASALSSSNITYLAPASNLTPNCVAPVTLSTSAVLATPKSSSLSTVTSALSSSLSCSNGTLSPLVPNCSNTQSSVTSSDASSVVPVLASSLISSQTNTILSSSSSASSQSSATMISSHSTSVTAPVKSTQSATTSPSPTKPSSLSLSQVAMVTPPATSQDPDSTPIKKLKLMCNGIRDSLNTAQQEKEQQAFLESFTTTPISTTASDTTVKEQGSGSTNYMHRKHHIMKQHQSQLRKAAPPGVKQVAPAANGYDAPLELTTRPVQDRRQSSVQVCSGTT